MPNYKILTTIAVDLLGLFVPYWFVVSYSSGIACFTLIFSKCLHFLSGNEIKLRYVCNQLLVRKFSKESYAASNMLLVSEHFFCIYVTELLFLCRDV